MAGTSGYSGFELIIPGTQGPWGQLDRQLQIDIIDTLVGDAVAKVKDAAGHKHKKIYDENASIIAEGKNGYSVLAAPSTTVPSGSLTNNTVSPFLDGNSLSFKIKSADGTVTIIPYGASGYSGWSGYSGRSGYDGSAGVSGYSGWSGYDGAAGAPGVSGYSGVGITWYGTWLVGTTYNINDAVAYAGSSYISIVNGNVGQTPADDANWDILSSEGSVGISGYSGYDGAIGISGYSGYDGAIGISGYSGYTGTAGTSGYSGLLPAGTSGYHTYYNGSSWQASPIFTDGTNISVAGIIKSQSTSAAMGTKYFIAADSALTHEATDYAATTDFFTLKMNASSSGPLGGTDLVSISRSSGGVPALRMYGIHSSGRADLAIGSVEVVGAVGSGTGITDIADGLRLFTVRNNATERFSVYGNGDVSTRRTSVDTLGNSFKFFKSRGVAGAGVDGDVIGTVLFESYDDNGTPELETYASIIGSIADSSSASPKGRLDLCVAPAVPSYALSLRRSDGNSSTGVIIDCVGTGGTAGANISVEGGGLCLNNTNVFLNGGLHIGGALGSTAAGDDNLLVDGTVKSVGDIYSTAWTDWSSSVVVDGFDGPLSTQQFFYKIVGKTMHIKARFMGTSNSFLLTFTIPFAIYMPIVVEDIVSKHCVAFDLSARLSIPGYIRIFDSTKLRVLKDSSEASWTSSGTKGAYIDISVELA